eukprot:TRINITY_DN81740_c0_g1_i1.p1 TRINITY_DN81740_c0_g1~~TRINITY_DN81740_c0_g1_i1.p1  ORF type:complete len:196 (-),score=31.64 TRINITY_DN81740_c0_g1_i1:244-831(-)
MRALIDAVALVRHLIEFGEAEWLQDIDDLVLASALKPLKQNGTVEMMPMKKNVNDMPKLKCGLPQSEKNRLPLKEDVPLQEKPPVSFTLLRTRSARRPICSSMPDTEDPTRAQAAEVGCEASAVEIIIRETERLKPKSCFRPGFHKKVNVHTTRHPGGMLPCELRLLQTCIEYRMNFLNDKEFQRLQCFCCGRHM